MSKTVQDYIDALPEDRKIAVAHLRDVIAQNIPGEFSEGISSNMIGWAVPHKLYPKGYHCDPKLPLPFLSIASQKNFIALYHMGLYADEKLLSWFVKEYPLHSKTKLDMGKSCVRFKKISEIPYDLIAELVRKISVDQWIQIYEKNIKR